MGRRKMKSLDKAKVGLLMEKIKEDVEEGKGLILIEKFLKRLGNTQRRKRVELEIIEKLAGEIISTLKTKEIIEGKIF